jgi:hypothetical protein
MDARIQTVWAIIKTHLWGPAGSVLFHVVAIVLLLKFAVNAPIETSGKVDVTVMEADATKLDDIDKKLDQEIQKLEEQPREIDNVAPPSEVPGVATENAPGDEGGGTGNLDTGTGIGSGDASLATGFEINTAVKSALVMKGLYANRTAGGRKGALGRYGGSGRGEDAVLRALRWLKNNQGPDGSWAKVDNTDPTAMAGLALLAFLAHNETPASEEFGPTVEAAMKFVVGKQSANGVFGRDYTHGICTYAVSEGFALTKIMALKDAMDKGIAVIINGQQPLGGFDYGYKKGDRWDLSVAGWQFQAMKAAKMAGCSNEKLEDAIKLGVDYLRKQAFAQARGGFGYSGKPGEPGTSASPSMTGAGTLCLQLLGYPNVPEVRAGLEFLKDQSCVWAGVDPKANEKEKKEGARNPLYGWYYITQAKFQRGGKEWDSWNMQFSKALISGQAKDGHWEGGDHGGSVYTTTLCCLMLEVYYRYLPSYQKVEDAAPVTAPPKTDEVTVKVM